jgi:hypothetical protein
MPAEPAAGEVPIGNTSGVRKTTHRVLVIFRAGPTWESGPPEDPARLGWRTPSGSTR